MEISFRSSKLKQIFASSQKLVAKYGDRCASKIRIRIGVLTAAENLDQIPKVKPDRCHELKNDHRGSFAID
jgi:plasmid maintenance system killer protein